MRGQYFYHIRTVRVVQVLCEVSIKVLADDTLVRDDDKQMRFFFQMKVISGSLHAHKISIEAGSPFLRFWRVPGSLLKR